MLGLVLIAGCGLINVNMGASMNRTGPLAEAGPPPDAPPTYEIGTLADASRVAGELRAKHLGKKLYVRRFQPVRSITAQGILKAVQGNMIVVEASGKEYREELVNLSDIWVLE